MPKIAIVLYGIVLLAAAVAAPSALAEDTSSPAPSLPSLARASAYFDSTQVEIDRFMESICQMGADENETALENYVQNLSRLHVELAALRIGKQERGFVTAIVEQLKFQKSQLISMAQGIQPNLEFDLKEAIEHLDRVVEVAEEKLDGQVPAVKWRYGWKPTGPEKRWEFSR